MKNGKPKVAIVHDWLVAYAGADRVVDCMHHVFPDAPIYTLVYDENNMPAWFKDYDIRTTYLQKLPFATKLYRAMLPWMPRYVWDFYYTYRNNANALVRAVMPGQMLKLRQWDKCAADRVDYFIANSHYIAKRIKKYYRRDSDVIYPCVHINEEPFVPKEDFYLVVGRFTWYKRIDLAVAACTKLNKPLIVIGGGGEGDKLRAMAGPTIRFLGGGLSDEEVRGYYLRAKAFLFPGEEDFGITPVEAQSAGTPVLAFGRGGACETVLDGKTGLLFDEQTPESLEACIQKFETEGVAYPPQQIREHSRSFSEQRFEDELRDYCTRRYADWQRELEACSHHETAKEAEE